MAQFNIDPDEVTERIEERLTKQKKFARIAFTTVSFGLFILFNFLAWGIMGSATADLSPEVRGGLIGGMILLDVGWFVTLIYLGIMAILDLPAVDSASRKRLASHIMGEMLHESLQNPSAARSKRKRQDLADEPMTIGDDGELIPDEDETKVRRQTGR